MAEELGLKSDEKPTLISWEKYQIVVRVKHRFCLLIHTHQTTATTTETVLEIDEYE